MMMELEIQQKPVGVSDDAATRLGLMLPYRLADNARWSHTSGGYTTTARPSSFICCVGSLSLYSLFYSLVQHAIISRQLLTSAAAAAAAATTTTTATAQERIKRFSYHGQPGERRYYMKGTS